ncbi:MAG TPA: hypothetical protein VGK17_21460 [Propionicimonas sp.]|jgi:hypothetical protein
MRIVAGPRSVEADRWIIGLNRPEAGVLAAAARPASDALWSLAAALHRALGQQQPLLTTSQGDRDLLATWIQAYRIADVIVHHADPYPPTVLHELEALLTRAGARTWYVVDASVHPLVVQEMEQTGAVESQSWAAFRAHWEPLSAGNAVEPAGSEGRLDPAPAWAIQHARLERAATRRIDLPYIEGFCAAAGWTRRERPTKVAIAGAMRETLDRFDDAECFVAAVRGLAVALHELGWQVTLDVARLAGQSCGVPLSQPGDVVRLGQIRHFRDPRTAAVTALAALDLSRDEILGLQLADVARDGDRIELWHDTLNVPEVVRPVLRAQLLVRTRDGAVGSDPFFVDGRRPLSARRFATLAIAGLEELGSEIPQVPLHQRPSADERWLLERGVALRWMTRADRQPTGPAGMSGVDALLRVIGELAHPDDLRRPVACVCTPPHSQPVAPDVGTWPPVRQHARPSSTHPWKTLAYRS